MSRRKFWSLSAFVGMLWAFYLLYVAHDIASAYFMMTFSVLNAVGAGILQELEKIA